MMNGFVSEERLVAFERLRSQCPPSNATLRDARQTLRHEGGQGVTEERFEHEVALLKDDARRSGLTTILWGVAVVIALAIMGGFLLHKALFSVALFALLGGSSWYFMRKQKNYELTLQIDRELMGRE